MDVVCDVHQTLGQVLKNGEAKAEVWTRLVAAVRVELVPQLTDSPLRSKFRTCLEVVLHVRLTGW